MIPSHIQEKIKIYVQSGYNTIQDGHFETLADLRESATQDVEHGYSLAESEIERLKGLIEKIKKEAYYNDGVSWGATHEQTQKHIETSWQQFKTENNL